MDQELSIYAANTDHDLANNECWLLYKFVQVDIKLKPPYDNISPYQNIKNIFQFFSKKEVRQEQTVKNLQKQKD